MRLKINSISIFLLRVIRRMSWLFSKRNAPLLNTPAIYNEYCDAKDQNGNDAILELLNQYKGGGLMISKWGTYEISQTIATYLHENGLSGNDIVNFINGRFYAINESKTYQRLCSNAGVFPMSKIMGHRFALQALEDCKLIDILGSYIKQEYALKDVLSPRLRVNLDAFYAPWLFKNPWTQWLKGKKVLVVHPFVESINKQYNSNREKLFKNADVLPEFKKLTCIKAVQTQAGEKTRFKDWFEALEYMKTEIDKTDYEVAIIGCGAYGMSLAAHVKRQGKVAIHLAGWTQMLFGVYGNRWLTDQPQYSSVINEYWIRPNDMETPSKAKTIENGCYW